MIVRESINYRLKREGEKGGGQMKSIVVKRKLE